MPNQEKIALDCPICQQAIYRPLDWFRKTYNTCPHCGGGLAASQFAAQLEAVDEEFDAAIAERLADQGGCCGCHH